MDLLKCLFLPIQPFVWHPERIVVVSCAFFVTYFALRLLRHKFSSVRDWPVLIPAIIWGLFAVWEWYCKVQRYNIRVDLLLIYPILITVSITGLFLSFRRR